MKNKIKKSEENLIIKILTNKKILLFLMFINLYLAVYLVQNNNEILATILIMPLALLLAIFSTL